MTHSNPYLAEIEARWDPKDLGPSVLAMLASAHELAEANRLQEAIHAPRRVVHQQGPIAPEDVQKQMDRTKIMSIPDDSGDARIAAAARRWAEAYGNRNLPGQSPARSHLAASELLEAIRQEDER